MVARDICARHRAVLSILIIIKRAGPGPISIYRAVASREESRMCTRFDERVDSERNAGALPLRTCGLCAFTTIATGLSPFYEAVAMREV